MMVLASTPCVEGLCESTLEGMVLTLLLLSLPLCLSRSLSLSLSLSLPPSLPRSLSLSLSLSCLHAARSRLGHDLSLSLARSLSLSGHGVKADPPPRSVERPHPDILRGWAWLYRGKTLKGNEEKRRVPGRQKKNSLITGPANLVLAAVALHL